MCGREEKRRATLATNYQPWQNVQGIERAREALRRKERNQGQYPEPLLIKATLPIREKDRNIYVNAVLKLHEEISLYI